MQVIAISYSGYNNVVGDMFVVGILTDDSWHNTFRSYWSKNTLSIRLKRGILFEKLGDKLANHVVRRTRDKKLLAELYIDILNSFKEFWKYKIYMDSPIGEEILDLMNNKLPHNLRVNGINDIKDCDIKFMPHKSLSLAWALSEEYKFQQDDLLKKIWGDIGENKISCEKTLKFIEEHKDCPHIRWNEYPELKNEKEINKGE